MKWRVRRAAASFLWLLSLCVICPTVYAQNNPGASQGREKDRRKIHQQTPLDWGAIVSSHLDTNTVNSSWNGGTGNWSTSSDWNPNGVPNNGGGNTYNVTIDSGGTDLVSLDLNATINSLVLGGTTGSSTLQNLSGSAETLSITGALTVNKTGQLTFGNGSTLTVGGNATNAGSIDLEQASTLSVSGNFTNSGVVSTSNLGLGGSNVLTVAGTFTNQSGAQLNIGVNGGTNDVANLGTLTNNGSVTIGQGATLNLTNQPNGITDVVAGSTLDIAGTFNAGANNGLAKLNSIEGTLLLENNQTTTVKPGSGTLTVAGNLQLGPPLYSGYGNSGLTVLGNLSGGNLILDTASALTVAGNLTGNLSINAANVYVSGNLVGNLDMYYGNGQSIVVNGNMTGYYNEVSDFYVGYDYLTVKGTFTGGMSTGPIQSSDLVANFGKFISTGSNLNCCAYITTNSAINTGYLYFASNSTSTLTVAGNFTNSKGGVVFLDEGANQITTATLTNNGIVDIYPNFSQGPPLNLTAAGTLFNSGLIALLNSGDECCATIGIGANVSLAGGGMVTMNQGVITGTTGAPTFTNLDNTIEGSGNIGNGQMALNNKGLIDANDTSNPLMIQTSKGTVNTGTLEATAGGSLALDGNAFKNTGGTIQANGMGSLVLLENGAVVTGGTLSTSGGGLIETPSGQTATLSGLTNSGAYVMADNSTTFFSGKITNNGTISLDSTGDNTIAMIPTGGATLQGSGTLTLGTGGPNMIEGSNGKEVLTNASTIQGAGTISNLGLTNTGTILANAGTLTIAPSTAGYAFRNNGNLTVDSGSAANITGPAKLSFQTAGTVTINSGGALTVGGSATYAQTKGTTTVDGNLSASNGIAISGGTVFGNMGTLVGNFNLSGTGAISPGDGIMKVGELSINGKYTQGSTASALIDLGGLNSGKFDVVNITNAATLNGKLIVDLVNGFTPVAGNSFDIMNYASESGMFSSETLPTISGDHWLVTIGATDVLLQLLAGTGPARELRAPSAQAVGDVGFAGGVGSTDNVSPSALPPVSPFDSSSFSNSDAQPTPTPEPSTLLSLGSALIGIGMLRRLKRRVHRATPNG